MARPTKPESKESAASPDRRVDQGAQPDSESLSLDELSRAFAAMFEQPDAPSPAHAQAPAEPGDAALRGTTGEAAALVETHPRALLEAMLFVGRPDGKALSSPEIAGYLRGTRASEVDQLVSELNADYQVNACPYTIVSDGAGYRMTLRPEFEPLRDRCLGRLRAARLSPAAMEVLALVAYNEPLSAEEVSRMRGIPSGHILSHLVRRQLLRVERISTRPVKARYHTTPRFLKLFGLGSRDDLPRSEDVDRQ